MSASKLQHLRMRILKEAAIYILVLAAEFGAAYFLLTVQDDYVHEGEQLLGQITSLTSQTRALQEQFNKAQKSMPIYMEISKKRDNAGLSLNRQKVKDVVDKLKDMHYMPSIRLSVSPVVDAREANLSRKTALMISSEVGVRFEAVSDEELFAFIRDLPKELPGSVRMTKMNFSRLNPVTNALLLAITQKGSASMIAGEISFIWMGIRTFDKDDPQAPGNAPGGKKRR